MNDSELSRCVPLSAFDLDSKSVEAFYDKVYEDRSCSLHPIWKWLYRPEFYDHKIPLVLEYQNEVIAHAGMIPFRLALPSGEVHTASWYIDFAILPQFQRMGLGRQLTQKWMEFSDVYVTFCNEKSIGVFKKLGWVESFDTRMHHYFLEPLNHPKISDHVPSIVRKVGNFLSRNLLRMYYKRFECPLKIGPPSSEGMDLFFEKWVSPKDVTSPIRDSAYVQWRLLDSPDRNQYFIASVGENCQAIVKMRRDKPGSHHLDMLWVTDSQDVVGLRCLVSSLAVWCSKNGYSYIRHYVSDALVSEGLAKSLHPVVRHPRFAFYSKNPMILEQLKQLRWHLELIHSDFEFTG